MFLSSVTSTNVTFAERGYVTQFFDCTSRHGGHVGGKNNSRKVFWEFDSIIMQNLSYIFLLLLMLLMFEGELLKANGVKFDVESNAAFNCFSRLK